MLALLSPAKKLDEGPDWDLPNHSQPDFLEQAQTLINTAKTLTTDELQELMGISENLATLNQQRYQAYTTPFTPQNARPAILTFRGDTYTGLDADTLSADDITYAQQHVNILSGLYGLLRPLDLMQPYRLEMGTSLTNPTGKNLYQFWGSTLTDACNARVKDHNNKTVISLASNEYIKAIQPKQLTHGFITCNFKDIKKGTPKTIGLFAKRARGMMARYMIQQKVETPEALKDFDSGGYQFSKALSDEANYVFTRAGD